MEIKNNSLTNRIIQQIWKQEEHKNKYLIYDKENKKIVNVVAWIQKFKKSELLAGNYAIYEMKPIALNEINDISNLFSKKIKLVFLDVIIKSDEEFTYSAWEDKVYFTNSSDKELCTMLIQFICNKNLHHENVQLCKITKKLGIGIQQIVPIDSKNKFSIDSKQEAYFVSLSKEEKIDFVKNKFIELFNVEQVNYAWNLIKDNPNLSLMDIFFRVVNEFC